MPNKKTAAAIKHAYYHISISTFVCEAIKHFQYCNISGTALLSYCLDMNKKKTATLTQNFTNKHHIFRDKLQQQSQQ